MQDKATKKKKNGQPLWQRISGIASAFVLAMLITALLILCTGNSPVTAFGYLYKGAFSSLYNIGETVVKTSPLLIAALGLCICYRAGLTSIGAEGQMAIGGLAAAIIGCYVDVPHLVIIPLAIAAGMIAGGIWAGIAGYLKAKWGISEVINTIMLNYVGSYFVTYMCSGPIREARGTEIQTDPLLEQAAMTKLLQGTRIHTGVVIAVLCIFIVYFLVWKTPLGYQMRAVGFNAEAARTSGINVKKNLILAMFLSGAFCGLAGALEILAVHHRLIPGFTSSLGFDAMAIGLLGGLHPVGITLASLFFGALRAGATTMQRAMQISAALVDVIQGIIIILVLTQSVFSNFITKTVIKVQLRNKKGE